MRSGVLRHGGDRWSRIGTRERGLRDVGGKEDRLGGQEKESPCERLLFRGKGSCQRPAAGIQMRDQLVGDGQSGLGVLVRSARLLLELLANTGKRLEIREHELGLNRLHV